MLVQAICAVSLICEMNILDGLGIILLNVLLESAFCDMIISLLLRDTRLPRDVPIAYKEIEIRVRQIHECQAEARLNLYE